MSHSPYREDGGRLVWLKPTKDGSGNVVLTNFTARIVADLAIDDGAETRRLLELDATLRGRTRRITLPAERFGAMNWPLEHLGAGAVVSAGIGARDHARVAIQELSGDVPERVEYGHTGWRELPDGWAYLHAAGAIGAGRGVDQRRRATSRGARTLRAARPARRRAARNTPSEASLGVLDVAPERVTVPVLGAAYRAALGGADFAVHVAGRPAPARAR